MDYLAVDGRMLMRMKHVVAGIICCLLFLICSGRAAAQPTTFTPTCVGNATADTAKFTAIKATIGATATGTIKIPYKANSAQRCKLNTFAPGANITIDNTDGGGLSIVTGQTLTIAGPIVNPLGKQLFYNALSGQGTVSLSSNKGLVEVYTEWWGAVADGSTACQAAFDAAIAALPNGQPGVNGATIRLLSGDYRVTGISITDQQVHIIGSGGTGDLGGTNTATTFISSITNGPIIKYPFSANVRSYRARLENLVVKGNSTGASQVGVWVDNGGIKMRNVGTTATGSHGILLTHSNGGGSYLDLEIHTAHGDGLRLDFSASANPSAGVGGNEFGNISIGGCAGDAVRIMHGIGNHFGGLLDLENNDGSGLHIYYPGDGRVEPSNNVFEAVWNESNLTGDIIGVAAQNNVGLYVHYTSPAASITGNNHFRNAAILNVPAVDRGDYLILGDNGTAQVPLLGTPTAPTATLSAGPGLTGAYIYKVTYESPYGETRGGISSSTVNPANQTVHLSGIPVGPAGTTKRDIYRTAAGGSDGTQKFVVTISNNTTTSYDDTLADGSLGRAVPVVDGSGARILFDGDGNWQAGLSSQTGVISPQISDPKWPSWGFLSRPGFGMFMNASNELSFVADSTPNPVRKLRLLSTGVTDAIGGLTVGSGSTITKYLTGTASLDYAAWSGADCQDLTITVTGAADGDVVIPGIPNALASVAGVQWCAFVSSANTVTIRGCKITAGASANPNAATVRASVIQH